MARKTIRTTAKDIVRRELGNTGCVVTLSTEREGENLVGKLEVTDAGSDRTLLKLTVAGRPIDLSFSFGLACSQNEFMAQIRDFVVNSDFLRMLIPTFRFEDTE